jgi:DNA-binding GntR family transcriptional regulator
MYQLVSNLFTKLVAQLGPLYYHAGRDWRRSHQTHAELLVAIEARDAAAARTIIERMLGYSETAIRAEVSRLDAAGLIGPNATSGKA